MIYLARISWARRFALVLASAYLLGSQAQALPSGAVCNWTTLGTNAGPIPNALRSQPANLLRHKEHAILVDVGDGAAGQLAKAGVALPNVRTVVLSHLHFDHTAGLFPVIALRYQMLAPGLLTIYGPPGTRALVDGILQGMRSSPPAGARMALPVRKTVRVVEVRDGARFHIGDIAVSAVANSHYSATPGGGRFVAFSYRFDLPDRSFLYTGDTGPSAKVEKLAADADILVSEIIDDKTALARIQRARPDLPAAQIAGLLPHFTDEHLTPEQVGLLATRGRVKALVVTHSDTQPDDSEQLRPRIAANFSGPVTFARDLECF